MSVLPRAVTSEKSQSASRRSRPQERYRSHKANCGWRRVVIVCSSEAWSEYWERASKLEEAMAAPYERPSAQSLVVHDSEHVEELLIFAVSLRSSQRFYPVDEDLSLFYGVAF